MQRKMNATLKVVKKLPQVHSTYIIIFPEERVKLGWLGMIYNEKIAPSSELWGMV